MTATDIDHLIGLNGGDSSMATGNVRRIPVSSQALSGQKQVPMSADKIIEATHVSNGTAASEH